MKKLSLLTVIYAVILTLPSLAQFPTGVDFHTGFDGTNRLESGIDPTWTVSDTRTGTKTNAFVIGNCGNNWADPLADANWIGFCNNRTRKFFHISFLLPPFGCDGESILDRGSFVLNLTAWSDDRIGRVYLNGRQINVNIPNNNKRNGATLTFDRFWVEGTNEISIEVINNNGSGASLMVSASAQADSDGDGITDAQDKCPCTERSGLTAVGLDGCIPEICNNEIDDDGDGLIDGNDDDCITISGLCQGILGANVVQNGDFGSGVSNTLQNDPVFAPGYTYTTRTPPRDGFYTITNNTTAWGGFAAGRNWIDIGDNSDDPNGYMMVVNADFQPGVFFEKTYSDLCPNTVYEFSADIINVAFTGKNVILPNIDFLLGGRVVYSTGDIQEDEQWHRYGFSFSTGDNLNEITFTMRNNAPGGTGNDLAIDNISIRPCGPAMVISVETNTFCPNQVIPFTADVSPNPSEYQYAWQKRDTQNPGLGWINIPNTNQTVLNIVPEDLFEYRIIASTNIRNLTSDACIFSSNTITMYEKTFSLPLKESETICPGDSVEIVAGGDANSYTWTPTLGLSDATSETPIAFPMDTTTYYVRADFADGCFTEDSITIFVRPRPLVEAGPEQVICPGEITKLSASGGIRYLWDEDSTLSNLGISNPVAAPSQTQTYTVTVTDGFGCVNTDSVVVRVSDLNPDAGFDPSICLGGSTELQGSGGVSYSWFPGTALSDPNIPNPVASPLVSTQYILTVTNADNCVGSDTLDITVTLALKANAGEDASICPGDSVRLIGSGGAIYTWSTDPSLSATNVPRPFAKPLVDTKYYLRVEDNTGCFDTDSVEVFVLPGVTTNAGNDVEICKGDTIELVGQGNSPGSSIQNLEWGPINLVPNGASPRIRVSPEKTKTYTLTATNSAGCRAVDEVAVQVFDLPIAEAGNDTAICIGGEAIFNASGGIQYEWTPRIWLSNFQSNTPAVRPLRDTTYYLRVVDANGCENRDSISVSIRPEVQVNAGPDVSICQGDIVKLDAVGFGTPVWAPTLGLSNPGTYAPEASPNQTQDYTLTVIDEFGCSNEDTMTVSVRALPPAFAGPDTSICIGDSIPLLGSGGFIYQWSPEQEVENPIAQNTLSIPDVSTQYFLKVIDGFQCENFDTLDVVVNQLPVAQASEDTSICLGQGTFLTGIGGGEYFWSPAISLDDSTISTPLATPDTTTQYILGVRNSAGCVDFDSLTIEVLAIPDADAGLDFSICEEDTAQLMASGGMFYQWTGPADFSDTEIPNPTLTSVQSGIYTVAVGLDNGCYINDSLEITVNLLPQVYAGRDQELCEGELFSLSGIGNAETYLWSPSQDLSDPNRINTDGISTTPTVFTLTATSEHGCVRSDSMFLQVNPLPDVELPPLYQICRGQEVTLTVQGEALFQWSNGGGDSSIVVSPANTTSYTVSPISFEGCPGEPLTTEVEVFPWPIAAFDPNVLEGVTPLDIELTNTSLHSTRYDWNFGNGSSSTDFEPIYTYEDRGNYQISLISSNDLGCADTALSYITVYQAAIYLPNAFTPNEDGINDIYTFSTLGYSNIRAQVFSRWGDKIYEEVGESFKWDGTYKGEDVPEGVFVIVVKANDKRGAPVTQVRTITLLR